MNKSIRTRRNLANAAKSTGPRTPEGKAISSQNNFRHGFTGSFQILPAESQDDFDQKLNALLDEFDPESPSEVILIHDMARHHFLIQRALRLQNDLFLAPDLDDKKLSLYLRYQTTQERAFHRALKELLNLQKIGFSPQSGFESQKAREQQAQQAAQEAKEQQEWAKTMHQIQREEFADAKMFEETRKQLEKEGLFPWKK